tara:strand:- start:587 stop:1057 length:471 start_codon:yes stop_codon:yes gene_type:complete
MNIEYIKDNNLKKASNEIPLFSFDGCICKAKIVDVYDGDTFKCAIYHKNEIIKINCRTLGYDSHEMKPRLNIPNREEHIKKAKEARKKFIELTTTNNGLIYIDCKKYDKYGRVLVDVYIDKNSYIHSQNKSVKDTINNIMIKEGHGVPYQGGKKTL